MELRVWENKEYLEIKHKFVQLYMDLGLPLVMIDQLGHVLEYQPYVLPQFQTYMISTYDDKNIGINMGIQYGVEGYLYTLSVGKHLMNEVIELLERYGIPYIPMLLFKHFDYDEVAVGGFIFKLAWSMSCLLYTSPSPRD